MMSAGSATVLDSADAQSPPSVQRDCCHAPATPRPEPAPTRDRGETVKHLTRIESGIDTRPIRAALACNEDLWHLTTRRLRADSRPLQTHTIYLRQADRTNAPPHLWVGAIGEIHASKLEPHAWQLPEAVLMAQALAGDLGVELARAMLVRLPPGGTVGTHRDVGTYFAIRDRYHLAISNEPNGSILHVADDEEDLPLGSLWRIDNTQPHSARNRSGADRIHLIFDVLPRFDSRSPA